MYLAKFLDISVKLFFLFCNVECYSRKLQFLLQTTPVKGNKEEHHYWSLRFILYKWLRIIANRKSLVE